MWILCATIRDSSYCRYRRRSYMCGTSRLHKRKPGVLTVVAAMTFTTHPGFNYVAILTFTTYHLSPYSPKLLWQTQIYWQTSVCTGVTGSSLRQTHNRTWGEKVCCASLAVAMTRCCDKNINNSPKEHHGDICGEADRSANFVYMRTVCHQRRHMHSASGRMRERIEGEAPAPASIYAMTYMSVSQPMTVEGLCPTVCNVWRLALKVAAGGTGRGKGTAHEWCLNSRQTKDRNLWLTGRSTFSL